MMKNLLLLAGYVCLLGGTALVQAAINYADFDLDWIDDFDGVSSTSCTKANCGDCINFNPMCMTCPDRYAETDDQQKCVECPSNCVECEAPTEAELACTECSPSYFIDSSDECTQCDANCAVCASVDTCSTCNEGYFLQDDGSCSACSSRCSRCSSADVCSTCMEAAYKDGDVCKACPSNAKVCELQADGTTVSVSECYDDYLVAENNDKCLRCSDECATCSSVEAAGLATCLTCEDDHYLDGAVCSDCSTNCKACTDGTDCSTCKEEYIIKPDTVATCQVCDTRNCAACTVTGTGETCTSCLDGYWLDEASCSSCITNCEVCNDGTTCETCKDGYDDSTTAALPSTTEECLVLPSNCKEVDEAGADPAAKCAVCNDFYFEASDACTACLDNCKVCSDAATCTTCDDGRDDQTTAAATNPVECMLLPTGCATLTATANKDDPDCATCEPGYWHDTTADPQTCVQCITARCNVCVFTAGTPPSETCTTCATGNFGDGTSTCTRCISNCDACSDDSTCTTCSSGYGLTSDNTCSACAAGCSDCLADVTVCATCDTGYIQDGDNVCQVCPDNCGVCTWDSANSRTVCSAPNCEGGYSANSDGDCVQCPRECDECSLVTVDDEEVYSCSSCNEGYGRNTYFCADCPSNCQTCSYQDNTGVSCTGCDEGYYLSDGLCEACTTNCEMCTSSQCQECADGYGLSFDKQTCVDCEVLTGIEFCETCEDHPPYENDTASCEECSSGYYLKDQMHNGTDAECIAVSTITTLDCGAGVDIFDPKPVCKRTECDAGYTNQRGECIILCFMCGDPRVGTYVPTSDCITENGTDGVRFNACEDECYANYIEINGVSTVTTGCIPEDDTCPTTNGCSDTTNGENCELCCEFTGCNEDVEESDTYGSATRPSLGVTMMLVPLIMLLLK